MKPKIFVRTIFVAVALVGSACWAAETGRAAEDHRALYKTGLRAYRAGKIAQAIDLFRQSEDTDPTYPYPAFALARIYQQLFRQEMSHYADAVAAYERVTLLLRINPPSTREKALHQAFYFQGLLLLKGGDYGKATRSLETFLESSPDFYSLEEVHNAIGVAHYYQDQYDDAVQSFKSALELKPDFAEPRFNLRSVYTRLSIYNEAVAAARGHDPETALAKASRLREFAPRYLPGRRLEADLLRDAGQDGRAEAAYREIVALAPDDPFTYGARIELAKIVSDRGQTVEALSLLQENRKLFPRVADENAREELEALIRRLEVAP